jgi:putative YphP/YqiW family bacilliredoxin
MYDPALVAPMARELVELGVSELKTPEAVESFLEGEGRSGTSLLVVNSVCGCAAGMARPAVRLALENDKRPDRAVTVFAGVDKEATERARAAMADFPPSSPSFALFKDGEVVHFVPRHQIEGHDAVTVANNLVAAFNEHCG